MDRMGEELAALLTSPPATQAVQSAARIFFSNQDITVNLIPALAIRQTRQHRWSSVHDRMLGLTASQFSCGCNWLRRSILALLAALPLLGIPLAPLLAPLLAGMSGSLYGGTDSGYGSVAREGEQAIN